MNKISDFTKSEKDYYGKLYSDIIEAIDNTKDFIGEDAVRNRKFFSKQSIIKSYIELIDEVNKNADKKDILDIFRSDEKYKEELKDYKLKYIDSFSQCESCRKCKCFTCVAECKFNGCLSCKEHSSLIECDHKEYNVRAFDDFIIDLKNDKTGVINKYKVLCVVQNYIREQQYIAIENVYDKNEKYILYYYPGISEDTYGEISDAEEFDWIVSTVRGNL